MSNHPLIIIALDAADANLLEEWRSEGYLPALSAIMQQGSWGKIDGDEYYTPHGLWLSLYSGASKNEHGLYYFRQLERSSYRITSHRMEDSARLSFWSKAASAGARIAILDVPESYPIHGLEGCQLANFHIHNAPGDPASQPKHFLNTAIRLSGKRSVIREDLNSTPDQDREYFRQILERIRRTGRFYVEVLKKEKPDCTVAAFSDPHIGGHQLWKYRYGNSDMRDSLRAIYQAIDQQIQLIVQANPNANIYIVSNTGIQDQTPTNRLLRSFCESLGYQAKASSNWNSSSMIRFVRSMIPESFQATIAHNISTPFRQRLLTQMVPINSDWSRTTAFVLPSTYSGMIRINLKDREPHGIVSSGKEYESLLDQIESDLVSLIDPLTGRPAIDKIYRMSKIYQTGPPTTLPDLIVKWKSTKDFQETLVHPRKKIVQRRLAFFRANNHTDYGFFSACGPSIEKKGRQPNASLTTFAPRFLAQLGINPES